MKLSSTQKIVKFFSSEAKFIKIMEESKQWRFNCSCGKEFNIWDLGGVRYKSSGNPIIKIRCPNCRKLAVQKIFKVKL